MGLFDVVAEEFVKNKGTNPKRNTSEIELPIELKQGGLLLKKQKPDQQYQWPQRDNNPFFSLTGQQY